MNDELKADYAKHRAKIDAMSPEEYAELVRKLRANHPRRRPFDADGIEYRRRLFSDEPLYNTPSGAPPSGDFDPAEQLGPVARAELQKMAEMSDSMQEPYIPEPPGTPIFDPTARRANRDDDLIDF